VQLEEAGQVARAGRGMRGQLGERPGVSRIGGNGVLRAMNDRVNVIAAFEPR